MLTSLTPIAFAIITFLILALLESWIHVYLQGLSRLLTGNSSRSFYLYAIVLFPGVLLHEFSHWLMANLLGVPTEKISVWPRMLPNGMLVFGYVITRKRGRNGRKIGFIRQTLVGAAPILLGVGILLLLGFFVLDISRLAIAADTGKVGNIVAAFNQIFTTSNIWLWLYLLFTISNAMMPSSADREAWPQSILLLGVITVVLYTMGGLEPIWLNVGEAMRVAATYLWAVFSMAIIINLFFLAVMMVLFRLLIFMGLRLR